MRLVWLTCVVGVLLITPNLAAATCQINVSVATSLRVVVEEIAAAFENQHQNCQVNLNTSGSHALARQVKAGAAVDVFLPASGSVKALMAAKPVAEGVLAHGQLVLAGNKKSVSEETLIKSAQRIAIGQKTLPAGFYAHQYLGQRAQELKKKFVYADNVRGVMILLERGAVDAAFVYHTELARAEWKPVVVFPIGSVEVAYPKWLLRTSKPGRMFYEYLASPEVSHLLNSHHFLSANTNG